MQTVTLLKPHTHADIDYAAGAELELPDDDATWLRTNGVATLATGGMLAMTGPDAAPADA